MGIHIEQEIRWLRSRPADAGLQPDKIDAEAGIIRDVVMAQEGEAKGHGVFLDANFIEDLVEYDVRQYSKRGVKARFGHPGMSNETMGTQMGVFRNFQVRYSGGKAQAVADLHLLDAAEESPTHPGMRSWVLKMAAERPDFIMSSIVFRASSYFQKKPNGEKHILKPDPEEFGYLNYNKEYGKVWVEFDENAGAKHMATDLVEEGAATDNLFSNKVNAHLFVAQAGDFLADHPELTAFIQANPDKVTTFFQGIGISLTQPQPKKMSKFSLLKWLAGEAQDGEPVTEDLDALKAELSAAKERFTALQAEKEAFENRVNKITSEMDALQATVEAFKTEVEQLKADITEKTAEIDRLKKEPAALHTGGDTPPANPGGERAYHKDPVYQKAKAMRKTPQ